MIIGWRQKKRAPADTEAGAEEGSTQQRQRAAIFQRARKAGVHAADRRGAAG